MAHNKSYLVSLVWLQEIVNTVLEVVPKPNLNKREWQQHHRHRPPHTPTGAATFPTSPNTCVHTPSSSPLSLLRPPLSCPTVPAVTAHTMRRRFFAARSSSSCQSSSEPSNGGKDNGSGSKKQHLKVSRANGRAEEGGGGGGRVAGPAGCRLDL